MIKLINLVPAQVAPLCPLDISPKYDGSAVEFGGEFEIEIVYENEVCF